MGLSGSITINSIGLRSPKRKDSQSINDAKAPGNQTG